MAWNSVFRLLNKIDDVFSDLIIKRRFANEHAKEYNSL